MVFTRSFDFHDKFCHTCYGLFSGAPVETQLMAQLDMGIYTWTKATEEQEKQSDRNTKSLLKVEYFKTPREFSDFK